MRCLGSATRHARSQILFLFVFLLKLQFATFFALFSTFSCFFYSIFAIFFVNFFYNYFIESHFPFAHFKHILFLLLLSIFAYFIIIFDSFNCLYYFVHFFCLSYMVYLYPEELIKAYCD